MKTIYYCLNDRCIDIYEVRAGELVPMWRLLKSKDFTLQFDIHGEYVAYSYGADFCNYRLKELKPTNRVSPEMKRQRINEEVGSYEL